MVVLLIAVVFLGVLVPNVNAAGRFCFRGFLLGFWARGEGLEDV